MSTIAIIAIENTDKTINSIICSTDGYIEHTGKVLLESYNTKQRLEYLISHGSISILGSEIGKKHNFNTPREGWTWHNDYNIQTATPKNWCRFYYRDRGDELLIDNYKNEDELLNTYNEDSWAEFIYLYKDRKWYVKQNNISTYTTLSEQIDYIKSMDE
jgi:hypothetical protein|tara:strand:+ start:97 stop:573 length:477 start_codon:yes stop_codon:yes gene_type:complete